MNRKIWILLILMSIVILLAPKSKMEMRYKAKKEYKNVNERISRQFIEDDFIGPVINKSKRYKNELVYTWYKILPFNDTARVTIYISRSRIRGSDITMNESMNYLVGKPNNLLELFPMCDEPMLILNKDSLELLFNPDFQPLIGKEKLIYILENGYYDVFIVNKDLSVLKFWESIGFYKYGNKIVKTQYCRINLDENCQLLIKPFILPDSIENHLVLKEDGYHYMKGL